MYKGVVPFIILQLFALGIVGFYPSLVNYLPNRVYLTSETAPPPQNPRLQHCLEGHLFTVYDQDEAAIRAAIDKAGKLNLSYLPDKVRSGLDSGIKDAGKTFAMIENVRKAHAAYEANLDAYEPLHRLVRDEQKRIRLIEAEIEETELRLRRLSGSAESANGELKELEAHIAELNRQKAELEGQIPENWDAERKKHLALEKAETDARRKLPPSRGWRL